MLGNVAVAPVAMAQTTPAAEATQSVAATAESRNYSDDRGSFHSFTVEYKFRNGDTAVLLAPTVGERSTLNADDTSLGIRGTLYQEWTPAVSTRTSLFLAEKTPVFAHVDVAQDLTVRVADRTTLTTGVRWAQYFGDREATFYSLGARRYFSGGSVAYRLTRIQADGQDGFLAHLANLSVNDSRGKGKTQLWLASGDASLSRSQFDDSFAGNNRAIMLQRNQPLWGYIALVASAGLSSYEFSGGRYTATTFGIGLSADLN